MVALIKQLLESRPFGALHVLTSGGNRYRVASADHANLNPKGSALSF
jgi:hypothetical protein